MTQSLDFSADTANWELYEVTPGYRRWIAPIDDTRYVMKTEFLEDDSFIQENQRDLHDSQGKSFGDGKIVARIPLNVLYSSQSQIMEKLREGDKDHMKWFLNSESARPFRCFRGKV
jgi:hypothetical protein